MSRINNTFWYRIPMSVAASHGCHIGPNYTTAVIFNIPDHSGMSITSSVTSG